MKMGLGGEMKSEGKQIRGVPNQAAQEQGQHWEKITKVGEEPCAHGERQRVGGRVRWRSMGRPQWGQSTLGGDGVSVVSGWVCAEEVEVVNWRRCCWRVMSRERRVAPKKP